MPRLQKDITTEAEKCHMFSLPSTLSLLSMGGEGGGVGRGELHLDSHSHSQHRF